MLGRDIKHGPAGQSLGEVLTMLNPQAPPLPPLLPGTCRFLMRGPVVGGARTCSHRHLLIKSTPPHPCAD